MRRVENSCRIKQIYKTRLNWFCSCVRLCMPFGSHLAIHIVDALEKNHLYCIDLPFGSTVAISIPFYREKRMCAVLGIEQMHFAISIFCNRFILLSISFILFHSRIRALIAFTHTIPSPSLLRSLLQFHADVVRCLCYCTIKFDLSISFGCIKKIEMFQQCAETWPPIGYRVVNCGAALASKRSNKV